MQKVPNVHNWLEQLPSNIREIVLSHMKTISVVDGENIYAQNDESQCLYQIESGKFRVCNYSAQGREIVYAILLAGDCFGEMGLIDGGARQSHIFAYGDVKLRVLHKEDFSKLYNTHIEIPQSINLMLSKRLRLTFNTTEDYSLLTLRDRLARYLIRLAKTRQSSDGELVSIVDITQEDLGKMLGASRQSVGKELKYFESKGALTINYGEIHIFNIENFSLDYDLLMGAEQIIVDYDKNN
jgi:CRP-like cAMP-binding protein